MTRSYIRGQLMTLSDDFQRAVICLMLARHQGSLAAVSRRLGMEQSTLCRIVARLGLRCRDVKTRQGVKRRSEIDWRKEAGRHGAAAREALTALPPIRRPNLDILLGR